MPFSIVQVSKSLCSFSSTSNSFPRDFVQVMEELVRRNKSGEMETLVLCAWGLWYRRNKLMYENKKLSPKQAIDHALSLYQEHLSATYEQKRGLMPQCRWQPPPAGVLKLNIDGATFHEQCRSGVGMVLRDERGKVLFTASKPEHDVSDPIEIEFLAVLRGLQICFPLRISELEVESDSLLVVQELNKEQESMSVWGNLVSEIKRMLHRFPKVIVQHKGRMANAVAHCLARQSWCIDELVIWWDSFPEDVSQIIWHDALM
ncbi:uncharacterized protein LOC118348595 [Juglans regia]|uniref:Uncharacterized protein LOC118348595 n=1 Tax=Juglans regia TaxID=51240 RepID=A0A6P9ERQ1_JUGRE|nr:uncharacterized protein LOC118348595 [Juglans regia]